MGIGLLQNFANRFSFRITRKQFQTMYQKSITPNWYDFKNIDFFSNYNAKKSKIEVFMKVH